MSGGSYGANNEATGVISTMATAVIDGNSHFYFTIAGDPRIFDAALPGMLPIVKYKVGDQIRVRFTDSGQTCNVTSVE